MDPSSLGAGERARALPSRWRPAALLGLCAAPAGAATTLTPVWVATAPGPGRHGRRGPRRGARPGQRRRLRGRRRARLRQGQRGPGRQVRRGWCAPVDRHVSACGRRGADGGRRRARQSRRRRPAVRRQQREDRRRLGRSRVRAERRDDLGHRHRRQGRGDDVPSRLALSPTGAIYVAGGLVASNGKLAAALVKLTSAGKIIWKRWVVGPGRGADRFSALGLDGAGRVFCAGATANTGARGADCLLAAFSPAGRRLWLATWRGPAHLRDGVNYLAVTAAGKVYVVGWLGTRSGSIAAIRQYDFRGRFVWQATYTSQSVGRYRFVAVALLPRGGVAATGDLVNTRTGDSDIVTIGFAAHGPSLWQQIRDTRHAAGSRVQRRSQGHDGRRGRPRVRRRQRRRAAPPRRPTMPSWPTPPWARRSGRRPARGTAAVSASPGLWRTAPGGVIVTGQSRAHSGQRPDGHRGAAVLNRPPAG